MRNFHLEIATNCAKFVSDFATFNTKLKDTCMTTPAFHKDVSFLCHQIMVQFRELYQQSPAEAMLRFRIDKAEAEKIVNFTVLEMQSIAQKGILCFQLELPKAVSLHAV